MPLSQPSGIRDLADGAGSGTPSASAAELREARKAMARIEKQLTRLADREARLHGEMAAAATDPAALADLNARLEEVVAEKEELEARVARGRRGHRLTRVESILISRYFRGMAMSLHHVQVSGPDGL